MKSLQSGCQRKPCFLVWPIAACGKHLANLYEQEPMLAVGRGSRDAFRLHHPSASHVRLSRSRGSRVALSPFHCTLRVTLIWQTAPYLSDTIGDSHRLLCKIDASNLIWRSLYYTASNWKFGDNAIRSRGHGRNSQITASRAKKRAMIALPLGALWDE
jgi:hypothetical protein